MKNNNEVASSGKKEAQKGKFNAILILGVVLFIIGAVVAICLPSILTKNTFGISWFVLNEHEPNEIGDTVGGIMGPAVALVGAALTFLAFYAQIKANDEQKKQFSKSDKDNYIQLFENKFYILLDLHRQNVNEISIDNKIDGRRAFISMYLELKFLFYAVEEFYKNSYEGQKDKKNLTKDERYQIAYLIFFFGIGKNSSQMVNDLIGNKNSLFLLELEEKLAEHQDEWKILYDLNDKLLAQNRKYHSISFDGENAELNILYRPFTGHVHRLSHYIRHLFQTVKFVDEQNQEVISKERKYDYLSNLRAQLSVHEQLIIYYNSLSILGLPWRGKGGTNTVDYLSEYCLIKSMPIPLANFYLLPLKNNVFPEKNSDDKPIFEWTEIKKRMLDIKDSTIIDSN